MKDTSGKKTFCPANIYDGYYEQLKAMWIPKQSLSSDRKKHVIEIFEILRYRGELMQPDIQTDTYYLAKEGCLYRELEKRVQESNNG